LDSVVRKFRNPWVSEFPYDTVQILADIRPGSRGSIPERQVDQYTGTVTDATTIGYSVYFAADDGRHGIELWAIEPGIPGTLPNTGFQADVVSIPESKRGAGDNFSSYSELIIEFPEFDQEFEIVGVPQVSGQWNLDWLSKRQVGFLNGTAFPTFEGNSVISGHLYNYDGTKGPFYRINELQWGDEIMIRHNGTSYTYSVRAVIQGLAPNDLSVIEHRERDWLTLITCQGYDEASGNYLWRSVVQAVLIKRE